MESVTSRNIATYDTHRINILNTVSACVTADCDRTVIWTHLRLAVKMEQHFTTKFIIGTAICKKLFAKCIQSVFHKKKTLKFKSVFLRNSRCKHLSLALCTNYHPILCTLHSLTRVCIVIKHTPYNNGTDMSYAASHNSVN